MHGHAHDNESEWRTPCGFFAVILWMFTGRQKPYENRRVCSMVDVLLII